MFSFQEIIQRLNTFWEKQGCILQLGHNVEVGAGTFNPATFLRSLGPEPYKTAYVEPSKRPQDGRYGENPNRVQLFHQYQVILKPSPANVLELYLESLRAIGLDLKQHDIRFVHDDWESPTLGASGLGWEVWLDGMEITQFTYFQIVGSQPLDPITAEIAYGLERLAMYLQKVDSLFDLCWNDKYTFRDLSLMSEIEWSHYNFEQADVGMWAHAFKDFENEANQMLERQLPIVAYDFVLKASHAFNMLNARGVISTTERTHYIARIRDLSRKVAESYLEKRQAAGFPLLEQKTQQQQSTAKAAAPTFTAGEKNTLLLEIGSEELPATFIPLGMKSLEEELRKLLHAASLTYSSLKVLGAPRRLSAIVSDLQGMTKQKVVEKKGPAISACFDENGNLLPQGAGFLRSVGITEKIHLQQVRQGAIPSLAIQEIKGIEYLLTQVNLEAKTLQNTLEKELPALIGRLNFPKKMIWDETHVAYARPIRWLVCLYGEQVLPVTVGAITSGNTTRGHAQRGNLEKIIAHANHYEQTLNALKVVVCPEKRKESILKQLSTLEEKHGVKALKKDAVLSQVLYLSEYPELILEEFNPEFLQVPQEILISEMVEHQKYFPLCDASGTLVNKFVITADNTPSENIRKGNLKVLSARLADGAFLFEQDGKFPLEHYREKLKTVTLHKSLGTLYDKSLRLEQCVEQLAEVLYKSHKSDAARAAILCKADLATTLVSEFPELQGIIGRTFALHHGENAEVAAAIAEHWMPLGEDAPLPVTPAGIMLALADKLDTLLSYFAIGLRPTSSGDPYALRRQALGLLRIIIDRKLSLDLQHTLATILNIYPESLKKLIRENGVIEELLQFITARAKSVFQLYHISKEAIEASLRGTCQEPYDEFLRAKALEEFKQTSPLFYPLLEVYKRAKGQLGTFQNANVDPKLLSEPAEKALFEQLMQKEHAMENSLEQKDYRAAFIVLSELQPSLASLFDNVKILSDDPAIQNNRLSLLRRIFNLFDKLLDFSKISTN